MAYQEIEDDGPSGQFFKFNAIGDKIAGLYVGHRPATGTYAKPNDLEHMILQRDGLWILTPPTDAARKLLKAERDGSLKPGASVMLSYSGDKDVGQQSPMKMIKVLVDPEVKPAALALVKPHLGAASAGPAPQAQAAKPAPKPAPAPKADDPFGSPDADIPF